MIANTNKLTTNWLSGLHTVSVRKRRKRQIINSHRRVHRRNTRNPGKAGAI